MRSLSPLLLLLGTALVMACTASLTAFPDYPSDHQHTLATFPTLSDTITAPASLPPHFPHLSMQAPPPTPSPIIQDKIFETPLGTLFPIGTPSTPADPSKANRPPTIYFNFDSWTILEKEVPKLLALAQTLRTRPIALITIKGHTDLTGTATYNMVLGFKRAQAIKTFLLDLHIPPIPIKVMSYGKHQPQCHTTTPTCQQINRRAHIILTPHPN